MMMLAMPSSMSAKLEDVRDDPFKMWTRICAKYDRMSNNQLPTLCKLFSKCKLKRTKTEPDDWFTELNMINEKINRIDPEFTNSEKQMAMHIMNNMCKQYASLKVILEQDPKFLDDLTKLQAQIQNHWEEYHNEDNDDSSERENDDSDDSDVEKNDEDVAMMISDKEKVKWERVGKKSGGYGDKICSYCKKSGHDSENCFSKSGTQRIG